ELAELSPQEKRALLAKLLRAKAEESESQPARSRSGGLEQLAANVADLQAQVILDPAIQVGGKPVLSAAEPAFILLTGATGFLGAFLLDELLRKTQADIYCLVRCSNVAEGRRRIEENLALYLPKDEHPGSRIIPVPGDMAKPLLGLSEQQFEALADRIDAIYHSGAWVNWIYPYERLEPANVFGTQEILRLACQVKVKPLHFVSTISVFPLFSESESAVIHEQDSLDHRGVLYGGYMQTKWVAEKLVSVARSRGMPVAIYRPGLITGSSQTGAWNTEDVTSKLVKTIVELGFTPDLDAATDMTPVDYVSRAIVHLASSPGALGGVFHLTNPEPVRVKDLVRWLRSFGYPIKPLSYERWRTRLVESARGSLDTASHSVAPLFSIKLSEEAQQSGAYQSGTSDGLGIIFISQYARMKMKFDCQKALDGLANSDVSCPVVDGQMFDAYLTYFVRSGFLDAPPTGDASGV
ncbi:MAG: thioester reductase domain-containing protein, partial [Chloroflexota bacterium]